MTSGTETEQQEQQRAETSEPAVAASPPSSPVAPSGAQLPAAVGGPPRRLNRVRVVRIVSLLIVAALAATAGIYWWKQSQAQLPPGITFSNGRIEADEIDIGTKFAGRVADLNVDEGAMVTAGQVVARMDTRDLQQSLEKATRRSRRRTARSTKSRANVAQQRARW